MSNIEWKTIKGYEGLYEVSNDGRVRRLKFINGKHNFEKIRECKQTLNTYDYMTVLKLVNKVIEELKWNEL